MCCYREPPSPCPPEPIMKKCEEETAQSKFATKEKNPNLSSYSKLNK